MSKQLLIDARQTDETRVVVLNNDTLEDFDYEASHHKPIRGNIYLAKITRVEPSLQAAFVEYGGNRQGFLAFSEIHPDYYHIPVEDKEKLIAEQKALSEESDEDEDGDDVESDNDDDDTENGDHDSDNDDDDGEESAVAETPGRRRRQRNAFLRRYKIQEVIRKNQIVLIQAVKEERGQKGAALTTYISLAGRYCVLMPNTHHGGGVSRKISNAADRKKLKTIVGALDIPDNMAVIVRTAGSKRTKAEITRDFTYLMNSWNDIRSRTMESNAPALIHEEGNLVKRAVRDYYTSDVDEIVVDGEDAYKDARVHMKNLMPSHVKKVKKHKAGGAPLLHKYRVEEMLAAMHEARVSLKSGGYIIINQTEALVSIDVNSGRATRERNIEETALKTNLEAAEMIAYHLRLRDLAGLIVIDFIDMEVKRNQKAVERKLKEAVKSDRARIQIGGISRFGLLEMSRQRLRTSFSETVTSVCPHCNGAGRVHSAESSAQFAIHAIESEAENAKDKDKDKDKNLKVRLPAAVMEYLQEHKSETISSIEERTGVKIELVVDDRLTAPQLRFGDAPVQDDSNSGRGGGRSRSRKRKGGDRRRASGDDDGARDRDSDGDGDGDSDGEKPRRRRRRGKRGGRRRRRDGDEAAATTTEIAATETRDDAPANEDEARPKKSAKAKSKSKAKTKTRAEAETKAKAKPKAKTKAKTKAKAKTKSKARKATKKAANESSAPASAVNVVDVDSVAPASRKKGWWSSEAG